eukprot:TRINITY_DN21079_c0_g1_i5.p2 TRINITY_DN21079_c0_g1~~TRINITY_DN21079_c0_g1_i5.p2  ORF type:complete len:147 (-),score=51.25 TRINITY_DN21079_c0_g1_i5:664-1104(-)
MERIREEFYSGGGAMAQAMSDAVRVQSSAAGIGPLLDDIDRMLSAPGAEAVDDVFSKCLDTLLESESQQEKQKEAMARRITAEAKKSIEEKRQKQKDEMPTTSELVIAVLALGVCLYLGFVFFKASTGVTVASLLSGDDIDEDVEL